MDNLREKRIETFVRLGVRFASFGEDPVSEWVMAGACRENGWFTPVDIRRAVEAIRREMLDGTKLRRWLDRYPALPSSRPRNVGVIAAGNIPLVGFFDLLCVVASGHRCLVKPAAKDRELMEYICGLLREIEPAVAIEEYDGRAAVDGVIATGSDNANRYFRSRYGGIPALLRGNRHSVAVLSGRESESQLEGLADDIWAYSGLGCRNVSLLFVPEGYDLRLRVPDGMNPKFVNNYRQARALLTMEGQPFVDAGGALLVSRRDFPRMLSELAVAEYRTTAEVDEWLAAHDGELQCVVSTCVDHSRRVDFGRAQSPTLMDYPDDRDILRFLTTELR